ncbi:MAG: DNA mismatch repair endonuclease MutL [Spirochaetales bacterium]|nr:DNA mismatch repair endonuclease MutL [Spirochaetales bacterium]
MSAPSFRPIQVLPEAVARRIAAGEVIERPASLLRELLDNALDAGARQIEVRWDAGGLEALQVTDDGWGMSAEDLELCWLPHATSKIHTLEDLDSLTSLGFRGEALGSVAACSRLSIVTAREDSTGYRLEVNNGRPEAVKKAGSPRGTTVRITELFHEVPARKRFLKSPSAESQLCRKIFDEKALAFPEVGFRLVIDGKLRLQIEPQTLGQRLGQLWGSPWDDTTHLREFQGGDSDAQWTVWVLLPPAHRSDRKKIHIWANRRPLQEFAFVQAVSYAFEGWLPGGAYPYAAVFLEIAPHLVDFNIHPTKREARFRGADTLHRALVQTVRAGLQRTVPSAPLFQAPPTVSELPVSAPGLSFDSEAAEARAPVLRGRAQLPSTSVWDNDVTPAPVQPEVPYPFRYLGQVLGVFLVVEKDDILYLVDQHAAHERLLYDELRSSAGQTQELLFPRRFWVEPEVLQQLKLRQQEWETLGIGLRFPDDGVELFRLPQLVAEREGLVIEFLTTFVKPPEDIEKDLYATLACRSAVMDGDPLAPQAARDLVNRAFRLENARCPHGRPLWVTLTRQELFERIGRLV